MKSRIIAMLMLIAAAVALITATQVSAEERKPSVSQSDGSSAKADITFTGRIVIGKNSYIIVDAEGRSPIVMSVNGSESDFFSGYNTGDRVEVMTSLIAESYPAQTHVYNIKLLEKGNEDDIPFDVISSLRELGWIS